MKLLAKVVSMLIAVCMVGCLLTACGSSPEQATETKVAVEKEAVVSSDAPATEEPAGDFLTDFIKGKAIKEDGTPLKVGLNVAELKSEFIILAQDYAAMLLKEAGAEVSITNANNSVDTQMNQMDDFIEMGVDVIIVQPADSEALAPAIKKINDAGIPVICINRSVYGDGIKVDLAIGADDQELGRIAAQYVAECADGKDAKIATMQGTLATANAHDRAEGFSGECAKNANLNIVSDRPCEWDSEAALAATQDVLTANPDLFAIFSHSDCMSSGIVSGLTQADRAVPATDPKHVLFVSIDGAPNGLDYIRQGMMDATVEQSSPMMAVIAVKAILEKVVKGLPLSGEKINVAPVLITADNVDDPSLWGNYDVSTGLWSRTEEVWNTYLTE